MQDQGSKGWEQRSEGWDQGLQLRDRDHKPWDQDQQFLEGSGIRLYHFCGIRDQNLSYFWNQGSAIEEVQGKKP